MTAALRLATRARARGVSSRCRRRAEVFAALELDSWFAQARGRARVGRAGRVGRGGGGVRGLLLSSVKTGHLSSRERAAGVGRRVDLTAALYGLSLALQALARGRIEYAKRLRARGRRGVAWKKFEKVGGDSFGDGAARADLRLTLRCFSRRCMRAARRGAGVLFSRRAGGGAVCRHDGRVSARGDATWLPRALAVKFACVAAASSLAALVPLLVAHQSPHFWLERAAGVSGEEAWRAKLYYARAVTLPAAVAAWAAGVACGAAPAFYVVPLLGECLWVWWLAGTLAGGLAFETPEQPGLCVIMVVCVTLAFGGFTASLADGALALAFGLRRCSCARQPSARHLRKRSRQ